MNASIKTKGRICALFALILLLPAMLRAQERPSTVTGKVRNTSGEELPGVTVKLKADASVGTATRIDGSYTIDLAPYLLRHKGSSISRQELVFSFIGMKSETVKIGNLRVIDVVLEEEAQELEAAVITGYQKIDRKLFTGAADVVDASKARMEGVVDVSRMLQGQSSGVQVTNVSGTFGSAPKIRIRGASSIYGNQHPLWVVDGLVLEDVVELSADDLSSGNVETLISSAVAGLNADDIESFQILKDASATALYGARAMNGVVVITTKKGRPGKTTINYNGEITLRMRPRYASYNIMNSVDQMSVYKELERKGWLNYADISRSPSGGEFLLRAKRIESWNAASETFDLPNMRRFKEEYLYKASRQNTDWFKELFRNTLQQTHSLSMASGSKTTNFYSSLSFFLDPGWTKADKVKRFTGNMNISHTFPHGIALRFLMNASYREQRVPGTLGREVNAVEGTFSRDFDINPFSYALNTSRTMRAKDAEGNPVYYQMNYAPFGIINEMESNFLDIDLQDLKFQGEIAYKLFPGCELNAIGAVRYVKSTREAKVKENSNLAMAYRAAGDATIAERNKYLFKDPDNVNAYPEVVLPKGGFYNTTDDRLVNYYLRLTLNYNKTLKENHVVNILLGEEVKYADRMNRWNKGFGYQWYKGGIPYVDYRIMKQILAGGFDYYGMNEDYDRFAAFFATAGDSWKGIYMLNLTGRYDGSNRLGRARSARWLPTWNISASWNVGEAFESIASICSNLKIRSTYGLTATMGPARNALAIFYSAKTFRPLQEDNETHTYIASLENKDLTWEKQYEFNMGVDAGIANDRLRITADYYIRKGFDLIGLVRTSGVGGENIKYGNYADMKSRGMEITLQSLNIKGREYAWETGLTFSYNKNEITGLHSRPRVLDLIAENGGALEGFPVRGLFSIPFNGLNDKGFPTYIGKNGETTVSGIYFQERQNLSWLKYEGPIDPKVSGGLNSNLRYKAWSLGLLFTYQWGNVIRLHPEFSYAYTDMNAMPEEMKNRWIMPGDEAFTDIPVIPTRRQVATVPGLGIAYNAYNYSTVRTAKGDFCRLKEVSLSFRMPDKYVKRFGMTSLEFKGVVSNPLLIYSDKKLNGQDPEFFRSGGVAMPTPKQFTLSVKAGF